MSHGAILKAIDSGDETAVVAGLASDDAGVRAFAATGSANLGIASAAPKLAQLVRDPNWIVRASAAAAAGQLGVIEGGLESALADALDDDEPVVQRLAIQALGKLESKDSARAILGFVDDSTAASALVAEAIEALGTIGDPVAVEPLLGQLDGPHQSLVIQALGSIGDARAFDPLVATFAAGVNGFVEWYIVAALRDIGERDRVFEQMAEHPDPETRRMLGRVAGEWWPSEDAVRALIKAMNDEAATARSGAAYRLSSRNLPAELHDPVRAALRAGLEDPDEDVRHWCTETLDEWE